MKLQKRYLVEEDKQLISPDQEKFFANSKVRNASGGLMICYHGTNIKNIKEFIPGSGGIIWFTPEEWYAGVHADKREGEGTIYKVYLNINKLLFIDNIDATAAGGKFNPRIRLLAGKLNTTADKLLALVNKDPEFIYDIINAEGFSTLLTNAGYDGVEALEGLSRSYGVLNSNQIKRIDNDTPTDSNKIDENNKPYLKESFVLNEN